MKLLTNILNCAIMVMKVFYSLVSEEDIMSKEMLEIVNELSKSYNTKSEKIEVVYAEKK